MALPLDERLYTLRVGRGWSLTDLAEHSGIPVRALEDYEAWTTPAFQSMEGCLVRRTAWDMPLVHALMLAQVYGLTVEALLDREGVAHGEP